MRRPTKTLTFLAVLSMASLGVARATDPIPTLHLGLHAPFTGLIPVNAAAIEAGADLYWRYLHDDLGVLVHGKQIEVHIANDEYNPTTAVSVCNKLVTQDDAFLLMGATGTDQINACASFADQRGIPYFSPGVQETGLSARNSYFALSMTYPAQSRIIAEFIVNELGASVDRYRTPPSEPLDSVCDPLRLPVIDTEVPVPVLDECPPDPELNGVRIALVRQNTPNYNETEEALRTALRAVGSDLHLVYAVLKEGNSSEAQQVAAAMKRDGVDVIVTTTQAVFTLVLADYAARNDYLPRYLMYGITAGINAAAPIGCGNGEFDQASAFSPWPGWDAVSAGGFDPNFQLAAAKYASDLNDHDTGDVLLWMWGMMKNVHQILDAAGPDPARADLIAMLDGGYSQSTGVFPDFSVSPGDHFGVDAVHRLEVDCDAPDGAAFLQGDAFVTGYPPTD